MPSSFSPSSFNLASFNLECDGPVARITLDRPDKHNALDRDAWVALGETVAALGAAPEVRSVVIAARGGRAFCSGADIAEFATAFATADAAAAYGGAIAHALETVAGCPKPVIAEIDGACVGGGCALAMACDLRYASERSRFAITPVKIGAAYSYDDTRRLVSLVGPGRAKEILFFADFLSAEEACAAGLVNRVLPAGELRGFVAERAALAARRSRNALGVAKAVVNSIAAGAQTPPPEVSAAIAGIFASADFREGYAAFLEKRAPEFA
ncbi:enoyl-CoA hydratase/carnithine racemase [Azospirillum brasilense]|uniref:Enoyl-CoA hydratase/carnithine racemase n=1 Tax=Azospirillum brasilense TaxID=192 RepID=A0A560CDD4_AZOBR|nr:enoyl-CoA hydratase-related protein [Azospirillum brasilense]TWA82855.1 enoyl-CoA hydratase/carnithine racemase [Azospirillum brasilense]